jgi:hypothetical protein
MYYAFLSNAILEVIIMRNPLVLAAAFKNAKGKLAKIKQLSIRPDMDVEEVDIIILQLAEAKAIEKNLPMTDFVSGQQWYVKTLVEFSGMSAEDRLETEYQSCFADIASEEELLAQLV